MYTICLKIQWLYWIMENDALQSYYASIKIMYHKDNKQQKESKNS